MENLIINVIFTAFMFGLAFWDYLSYGKQKHRDFKSIIMSAGVLGTFVGIFVGLQDFDVSNVENSVPSLLAGLKTAFYTSILGMALAILLSILQKSKAVKTDFENMLDYFSLQAGKLDKLEKLESLDKLQEIVAQNQTQIESQNAYYRQQVNNFKVLEDNFVKTNAALKEAMHHLAQGASKELIAALEGVIKDFNQRIT
ncbi:MotA/TolQ/ExbB proton channel family protein, partial [Helicobacter sp. UBA3407]